MTMTTHSNVVFTGKLHGTFEGEFMNAFKKGRGRILAKPVVLETEDGVWTIVKIVDASWAIGSATLVSKIEVVPPPEMLMGLRQARLELDFRPRERSAKLALTRLR